MPDRDLHNAQNDEHDALLVALFQGRLEHHPEAEPVTVEHHGDQATLVLHDETRLTFDVKELISALEAA